MSDFRPVEEILSRLNKVEQVSSSHWKACCPAHEDHNPSLSVNVNEEGCVWVKCYAGCNSKEVWRALGMTPYAHERSAATHKPFAEKQKTKTKTAKANVNPFLDPTYQLVASYDYRDANGELLKQVCRFLPKTFRQRRPDHETKDGWSYEVKSVKDTPYRLPEISDAIADEETIYIVEGEKDVDNMVKHGFNGATCNSGGATKWTDELSRYLAGAREVVIIPDKDQTVNGKNPGKAHAIAVGESIRRTLTDAVLIKIIWLPDVFGGKEIKDVSNYFEAGGSADSLRTLIDAAVIAPVPVMLPGVDRTNSAFVADVCRSMGSQTQIYIHEGEIVRIERDEDKGLYFRPITPAAGKTMFDKFCDFYEIRGKDRDRRIHNITKDQCETLLSAPDLRDALPRIREVYNITVPYFDPFRNVKFSHPGYNADVKLYVKSDAPTEIIPATVEESLEILIELLQDFCFKETPETPSLYRNSAIAYLLTCYCKPFFNDCRAPIFYTEGNRPGIGKDTLLYAGHELLQGWHAEDQAAKDENELSKELFAALKAGNNFFTMSNVKKKLDNAVIEGGATSCMITGRILGESTSVTYRNSAIWAMSGNNLQLSQDMARRVMRIKLYLEEHEIDVRKYKNSRDFFGYFKENRSRILGACRRIVSHWAQCGCPEGEKTKASFTRWAAIIGGIMESVGLYNPISEDKSISIDTNPELEHFGLMLNAWSEDAFRYYTVKVDHLAKICNEEDLFGWYDDLTSPRNKANFGKMLRKYIGREFPNGLKMIEDPDVPQTKYRQYKLVSS